MPRDWKGNRRSGVALAMRHGLKWFIHLWAQRPRVGDEHPAYAPAGAWLALPFFIDTRSYRGAPDRQTYNTVHVVVRLTWPRYTLGK